MHHRRRKHEAFGVLKLRTCPSAAATLAEEAQESKRQNFVTDKSLIARTHLLVRFFALQCFDSCHLTQRFIHLTLFAY